MEGKVGLDNGSWKRLRFLTEENKQDQQEKNEGAIHHQVQAVVFVLVVKIFYPPHAFLRFGLQKNKTPAVNSTQPLQLTVKNFTPA